MYKPHGNRAHRKSWVRVWWHAKITCRRFHPFVFPHHDDVAQNRSVEQSLRVSAEPERACELLVECRWGRHRRMQPYSTPRRHSANISISVYASSPTSFYVSTCVCRKWLSRVINGARVREVVYVAFSSPAFFRACCMQTHLHPHLFLCDRLAPA